MDILIVLDVQHLISSIFIYVSQIINKYVTQKAKTDLMALSTFEIDCPFSTHCYTAIFDQIMMKLGFQGVAS